MAEGAADSWLCFLLAPFAVNRLGFFATNCTNQTNCSFFVKFVKFVAMLSPSAVRGESPGFLCHELHEWYELLPFRKIREIRG